MRIRVPYSIVFLELRQLEAYGESGPKEDVMVGVSYPAERSATFDGAEGILELLELFFYQSALFVSFRHRDCFFGM